jgi:hypothetical protein
MLAPLWAATPQGTIDGPIHVVRSFDRIYSGCRRFERMDVHNNISAFLIGGNRVQVL